MMQAAAIRPRHRRQVFIDNSALAHGATNWLAMTDDGSPDAISFAFAAIVGGKVEIWTMGMHVLGLRDIVMKRADVEDGFDIVDVIRYMAKSEEAVGDGHIIADLDGPRFRTVAQESPKDLSSGPMHNPFGRLKLVSLRTISRRRIDGFKSSEPGRQLGASPSLAPGLRENPIPNLSVDDVVD